MKSSLFTLKSVLALFIIFQFATNLVFGQNDGQSTSSEQDQIVPQCLTHVSLYEQSGIDVNSIETFYVLNHGVELNFTSDLSVNNTPVVLVGKSDLVGLNSAPYFLFHTLNIEDSKAFAKVYLTYSDNGEIKTSNVHVTFLKLNGQWQILNNQ